MLSDTIAPDDKNSNAGSSSVASDVHLLATVLFEADSNEGNERESSFGLCETTVPSATVRSAGNSIRSIPLQFVNTGPFEIVSRAGIHISVRAAQLFATLLPSVSSAGSSIRVSAAQFKATEPLSERSSGNASFAILSL